MNQKERELIDQVIAILDRYKLAELNAREILIQARMQEIDLGSLNRPTIVGTVAEVCAEIVEREINAIRESRQAQ